MKRLLIPFAVLGMSFFLSACGGGESNMSNNTPPPPPKATWSNTKIVGKVTGTDLQLNNAYLGSFSSDFFGKTTLIQNVVSFDLSALVPGPKELFPDYYSSGCKGSNSDPAALVYGSASLNAYSVAGDPLGYIREKVVGGPDAALPEAALNRLYADRPFTYKGICSFKDEGGTTLTENVDITVQRGWNTLVFSRIGTVFTTANASPSDQIELAFTSFTPGAFIELEDEKLDFGSVDTVVVNANVVQAGNFSGTISLSTDIPALTVTPDTLTLSPLPKLAAQSGQASKAQAARLGALSLQPQLLSTRLTFKYTGTTNYSNQSFEVRVKDAGGEQVGQGNGHITVSRAGIDLYVYTYPLTLGRNSTVELPFVLTSVMGFGGTVIVGAGNLPGGVKATSQTVILSKDRPATGSLTLTSDASLKPGVTPVTITAQGEGRTASATLNLEVPKPAVVVSIVNAYNEIAVYQGGTGSIDVLVSSAFGFQGATTVKLTGLPEGVTAAPVSVQVKPMESTTLSIPLAVAADADLGTSSVQVTSLDSARPDGDGPPARLTVRPNRVSLGSIGQAGIVAGDTGIWVTRETYGNGGFETTLRHIVGGKDTAAISLTGTVYHLLSLPDGSVLASGSNNTWVVADKGAVPTAVAPNGAASGAVDHLGRIWFIQETYTGSGYQFRLARWTLPTGATETVDAIQAYGSGGQLFRSNNGRWMLYRPQYSAGGFKINVVTGEVSKLSLTNFFSSLALDDNGAVYFTENGPLQRINADGTVTIFNDTNPGILIGFDRENPTVLWSFYSNGIGRLDLNGNKFRNVTLGDTNRAALLTRGGIGVLTSEFSRGEGVNVSFLTILR
ncbi:hypothetical protein ACI3L1_05070 [Deinococcus sp. SM5_A1]|uniref:hypothetical protein n=1 Tax=Deinococcus sp. SM5_A1 TaxID=3379094 RepID=UPI00385D760F